MSFADSCLIQTLIPHLPRFAEEEGDFYSVPRETLISALCQQQPIDRALAEQVVLLVETLLDTFAVLNPAFLQNGEWSFVSFPAQLLALSLLTAWGDPDSRFFAANFWNTQGIADAKKEVQRGVLHSLETARFEHHANQAAKPIRFIYVAWGIVKIDGKILFYQREDTQKRFDKQAGDYGLVGGRLNQRDVLGFADSPSVLKTLQAENADLAISALPETLKRELREEAGLVFGLHYQFKPWRTLKPYQQVQGSAPNHALTAYHFEIFQVDLTLDGYLFLLQQVGRDGRLLWFTLDEVAQGESCDGKVAYVKALLADYGGDPLALKTALAALPDSFTAAYRVRREKYGFTVLADADKPVVAGVLGKEKTLGVAFTAEQRALLLGLAAHSRGFGFASVAAYVTLLPFGWLDVANNPGLKAQLLDLCALVKDTDVVLENHKDSLFRLSLEPSLLYFDDALFTFSASAKDLEGIESKIPVTISRASFATAFGGVSAEIKEFKLSLALVSKLRKLSKCTHSADNEEAVKTEDAYKKGLHKDAGFMEMGLKALLRREAGMIKFCCVFEVL